MRNVKFKKKLKYKIIITIFLSVILSFIIIHRFSSLVGEAIINSTDALIKRDNALIFKKAFSQKKYIDIDAENLINLVFNSNGEIVGVDFKIIDCEKIMVAIIDDMNYGTNLISTEGYILNIPIGYITNSPLLLNLGPKIPIKIVTTDVALGSVNTSIREFGINNALIEIYINIEIETNAILPLKTGTTKDNYQILVASKIITGKVPNFYGGYFSKESSAINLPIT